MKKNSYCMLAALFTLLFSNLSFAVDVDPCASWPVTLEEDADGFYKIGSADALYKFACMVNNGATNISGKLTADICLNACKEGESVLKANGTLSDDASNFAQWTPIGTSEKPYKGTFDGNGYTIRGLYFNDESTIYVGLFGYIDESAKVQNVGVVDSYLKGCLYVGGVVGYNDEGTVSNVYNTGSVSGTVGYVGGVVGYNVGGTISNAYNTGSVSGSGDYVGGVVGGNGGGSISNVYNTGSVSGTDDYVGGVVGNNYGSVSNAYNTGSVSGDSEVGGVVGYNDYTVSNGFFNTAYYSGDAIGGGSGTANTVVGKTSTELANLTVGNRGDFPLLEGETESPWTKGIYYDKATGKLANSELPYLKSLPKPQDVEMEFNVKDNVIQISTAEDLKNFAKLVNEYDIRDVDAELTTSITLNSNLLGENNANVDAETGEYTGNVPANVWTPIGTSEKPYMGTFDGNGHAIRGLYFNDESTDYVGLFGYIGSGATVQNVGVIDSYIRGNNSVGGVVGDNDGGAIINVYNAGSVSGDYGVGGVVGFNGGTIGNVYNTGSVSGKTFVGGVVGFNGGTIGNVYNTGSVSGSGDDVGGVVGGNYSGGTVSNVYNTGTVSGGSYVGGVVGYNDNGTVSNGFFNTAYYSGNAIGGGTGTANTVVGKTSTDLANLTVGNRGDFPLLEGETVSPFLTGSVDVDNAVCKFPYLQVFGEASQPQFNVVFITITNIDGGAELGTVAVAPDSKISLGSVPEIENCGIPSLYKDVDGEPSEWDFKNDVVTENISLKGKCMDVLDGVYQIASAQDLMKFASIVNRGRTTASAVLTQDICLNACEEGESVLKADGTLSDDASNFATWTPIGTDEHPYTGTFDGNGYTIRGLYFNGENTSCVGLFGYINESAKVQNVGVVDSYFKGRLYVGGVVGYNYNGTVSNSYNTGAVSGGAFVGGVVGYNDNGTVSNVYNTGTVSGSDYVGGVVGDNDDGTVSNSYNTGAVSGGTFVGGVVGYNDNGTVSNGFFNAEVYNTEVTCKNCSVVEGTTGISSEEFADGTVALLLHDWCEKEDGSDECKEGGLNGSIWGQDLAAKNSLPDFSGVIGFKYGSVTFFNLVNGKADSAYVNASANDAVDFPDDISVAGPVKFKRTFAGSGYSTIMLPFTPNCEDGDCVEGVKFFEFNSYTDGEVQATEVSPKDLKANTPYLVSVTDGATELVFKNGGTFNTTTGDAYNSETGEYKVELGGDGAGWTIYGTYAYKTWEKGDAGLGKTYGFAANDGVNDPSIVGQFAKIGVGAYIYPMRAYLEYVAPAKQSRPAANGAARAFAANTVASLPETINVVIVEKGNVGTEVAGSDDASGEQTTRVIGTINTRTGEFKFANDRWFDLQGRYLGNKKPTQKGAYYNNGKKVIVK